MKKKLMRMPKVVTILVAVLIVAIFLGSMDVAAFFLADTVSLPGYGSSMIAEFMAGVVAFLLLPDPSGSSATMYYTTMYKNGKMYNLEVLYDEVTNMVYHFEYARKAMGNLPAIPK